MRLTVGQTMFHCGGEGGCLLAAGVEWPADVDGIWNALAARPVPSTRNWYPLEHVEAVKLGLAHGQSVDELWDENRAHEGDVI